MLWSRLILFTLALFLLVWGAAIADNLIGPIGFSVMAYAGLILIAVHFRDRDGIYSDIGRRIIPQLVWGIFLGILLISTVFAIEIGFNLTSIDNFNPSWYVALVSGILIQVIVAIGEELPFRGYLVPLIAKNAGRAWAIVGSSAIFSIVHLVTILFQGASPDHTGIMLVSIFFGGAILAMLYLRYGLAAAMGFHFSWNFFQYSVFGLTGGEAVWAVETTGEPLITGGALGPEAGLLGLAVLAAGMVILLAITGFGSDRRNGSDKNTGR